MDIIKLWLIQITLPECYILYENKKLDSTTNEKFVVSC